MPKLEYLGLAFYAGAAVAQTPPPPPPPPAGGPAMMMRADINGDGVITREEYQEQANQRFDRMDVNRDGKLDAAEMRPIGGRMHGMGREMPPPPPAPPSQ